MNLEEFYERVRSLTPGESVTYNGLELEKADGASAISSPDHSEVTVYNDGSKVESLTLSAMELSEVKALLDEIAEVDPADVNEWLNR